MENEDLLPIEQLCSHYDIEFSFVTALTDFGLLEITTVEQVPHLSKAQLKDLEKMIRLHYELDINMEGIDAVSHLLKKVNTLQEELNGLRNRLRLYERN
jgi:hypothetical protein